MPTIWGVNFGHEVWWVACLKPWKNRATNHGKALPSKLAEKFASNFPKSRQAKIKIHPKSALQNLLNKLSPQPQRNGRYGALGRSFKKTPFSQASVSLVPTLYRLQGGVSRQHQCDLMQLAWLQLSETFDFGGVAHESAVSLHVIWIQVHKASARKSCQHEARRPQCNTFQT